MTGARSEWDEVLESILRQRESSVFCALASEVEQNRRAKALWEACKRRGVEGRAPSLAWELKRIAGRLLLLTGEVKSCSPIIHHREGKRS